MSPEAPQDRRQEAVERALSAANVHRRRGDWEQAWRAVDDALAVDPQNVAVLEMVGHLNYDEGEYQAAVQTYQRVLELEPGRAGAEVGLGNAILKLSAPTLQLDAPDPLLAKRKPETAAVLALLVPGLGQAYALELNRGIAFFAAGAFAWLLVVGRYLSALPTGPAARRMASLADLDLGPLFWVLLTLAGLVHLAAAIDAWRLIPPSRSQQTLAPAGEIAE